MRQQSDGQPRRQLLRRLTADEPEGLLRFRMSQRLARAGALGQFWYGVMKPMG
ncbi:MAG TPA: hypothetical protein VMS64_13915 [Candidatus Methylomirabilis sp.]|nr:hypothetical protein [Candidatus Methylomirabilis sp.]